MVTCLIFLEFFGGFNVLNALRRHCIGHDIPRKTTAWTVVSSAFD